MNFASTTFYVLLSFLFVNFINSYGNDKQINDNLLRTVKSKFDIQKNTVSNIEFYTSNYGIFGLDSSYRKGGLFWPRNSGNQYMFGSGFWISSVTTKGWDSPTYYLLSKSYNPNSGRGWFVPGKNDDPTPYDSLDIRKYRTYFSSDFDEITGEVKDTNVGPNWPLWNNSDSKPKWLFNDFDYVSNINERNLNNNPKGPLYISDEDVYATFNDLDLRRYEIGEATAKSLGYPAGLQINQRILSWDSNHPLKDVLLIQYDIRNLEKYTMRELVLSNVHDIDIAHEDNFIKGAKNDMHNIYRDNGPSKNDFGYAWTATNEGEAGKGFAYIAYGFIEMPIRDDKGNIIEVDFDDRDKRVTFGSINNPTRIDSIQNQQVKFLDLRNGRDYVQTEPNEIQVLVNSYPFNLQPGQSCRITSFITFGMPSKGGEADGTKEDLGNVIANINKALDWYYSDINSVNNEIDYDISVYPNPGSDYFQIRFPNSINGNWSIEIYTLEGQLIDKISDISTDIYNYRSNYLNSGTYFLRIYDNTSNKIMHKQISVIK